MCYVQQAYLNRTRTPRCPRGNDRTMVNLSQLDWHVQSHNKQNSWWANDSKGIPLRRVCDECEQLLEELYAPEILGLEGRYEDVVEDQIDFE